MLLRYVLDVPFAGEAVEFLQILVVPFASPFQAKAEIPIGVRVQFAGVFAL